jgi:hypothetical protein
MARHKNYLSDSAGAEFVQGFFNNGFFAQAQKTLGRHFPKFPQPRSHARGKNNGGFYIRCAHGKSSSLHQGFKYADKPVHIGIKNIAHIRDSEN